MKQRFQCLNILFSQLVEIVCICIGNNTYWFVLHFISRKRPPHNNIVIVSTQYMREKWSSIVVAIQHLSTFLPDQPSVTVLRMQVQ